MDEEMWDKIQNVNQKGVFFCSQTVVRKALRGYPAFHR